jgi:hypothetical protein
MLRIVLKQGARRASIGTAAVLVAGLIGASGAYAEDTPSLQGYTAPGGQTQGTIDQGGTLPAGTPAGTSAPASTPAPTGGTLPQDNSGNEVLGVTGSGGNLPAGSQVAGSAPVAATAPTSKRLVGNLPFTGLDLALLAIVGLALAGLGFGLRRLTGTPQAS